MGCISIHILRFFFVLCISFASDLSKSLTGLLSDIKLPLELSLASPISEFSLPTHVMCISSVFSSPPPPPHTDSSSSTSRPTFSSPQDHAFSTQQDILQDLLKTPKGGEYPAIQDARH